MPLSPPKQIPPHSSIRNASPTKSRPRTSPVKGSQHGRLIDYSLPSSSLNQSGLENVPNPFQDHNVEGLELPQAAHLSTMTEKEQQQAEAKERERLKILEYRDNRRKSMGMFALNIMSNF